MSTKKLPLLTEIRFAENELMFKKINQHIKKHSKNLFPDEEKEETKLEFICECSDAKCFHRISLTTNEYNQSRTNKKKFIIYPGHQRDEVEKVTDRNSDFSVVEKTGVAGIVAENS